jgi:hypothetical protein
MECRNPEYTTIIRLHRAFGLTGTPTGDDGTNPVRTNDLVIIAGVMHIGHPIMIKTDYGCTGRAPTPTKLGNGCENIPHRDQG